MLESRLWLKQSKHMEEHWQRIKGYGGQYEISDYGRLKKHCDNGDVIYPKGQINADGYIRYSLSQNHCEKRVFAHRLVMETFCPLSNYTNVEVNHIDLDKTNNHITNLEWVSHLENMKHAQKNGALDNRPTRHTRPVLNVTTGERYSGTMEASKAIGVNESTLSGALHGRQKTCRGCIWRFADEI